MKKISTAEKYYRSALILFAVTPLCLGVVLSFIGILFYVLSENGSPFLIAAAALMVIFLPFIVYYLSLFIYYKKVTLSNIQKVKLEKTDTSYFGSIGFEVTVEYNGKMITVTTKHVFSAGIVGVNNLDEYSGKTVQIGFDENKDEWIVLAL